MNIDEVCALLDEKNSYREELETTFRGFHERGWIVVERKGSSLFGVVDKLKSQRRYPIVDKKLKIVLGASAHDYLRAQLFRYHYHDGYPDREYIETREATDRYLTEGHGYLISSMQPDVIVTGRKYRRDRYDKDLFAFYHVQILD